MPLKIGYLTCKDPHDRYIWSGIIHMMYVALKEHAGEVEIIGLPRPLWIRLFWHALDKTRKLTRQLDESCPTSRLARPMDSSSEEKFASPTATSSSPPSPPSELAFLKTSVPVFYLSDSTFKAQEGYYFPASDMSRIDRWQGNLLQRRTLHRVAGILLTSDWAAASAVATTAPTLPESPSSLSRQHRPCPDPVTLGSGSSDGKCRLLFVGVDWKRKGGQIAFETLQALRRRGIDAELTIVGCTPTFRILTSLLSPSSIENCPKAAPGSSNSTARPTSSCFLPGQSAWA